MQSHNGHSLLASKQIHNLTRFHNKMGFFFFHKSLPKFTRVLYNLQGGLLQRQKKINNKSRSGLHIVKRQGALLHIPSFFLL